MTAFWALAALLQAAASAVLAQSTKSKDAEDPKCTADLIAELCDYPSPGPFAVASSGREHCWGYCDQNPPCDFVIFRAGNPYTGTGTCWTYPGEDYDESQGSADGCSNKFLFVYDKPVCEDSPTATATAADCPATESPSPIASVCDYPPPDEECFYDCYASSSSANCLSICAEADSCAYAVFNPRTESLSPHHSGTCWVYPKGKYDESKAGACEGKPEQYVYNNPCPELQKPSTTSSSSTAAPTESGSSGSKGNSKDDDKDEDSKDNPKSNSASGDNENGETGGDSTDDASADQSKDDGDDSSDDSDDSDGATSVRSALWIIGLVTMGLAFLS